MYIPVNDLAQLNLTVTSLVSANPTILSVTAGSTLALGTLPQAVSGAVPALGKAWYDASLQKAAFTAYVDCSAGVGAPPTQGLGFWVAGLHQTQGCGVPGVLGAVHAADHLRPPPPCSAPAIAQPGMPLPAAAAQTCT